MKVSELDIIGMYDFYTAWLDHADGGTAEFAKSHGISEMDTIELIAYTKTIYEGAIRRKLDDRYDVKYELMGQGMHNYRIYYRDNPIGYALSEDHGWAIAQQYYINSQVR